MPKNGSDHFATLTHLVLSEDLQKEQDQPGADSKELKEAQTLARQALKE